MPTTKDMRTAVSESQASSPSGDLATLLSTLPTGGVEDDVSRLVEVYEAAERVYRDASLAGMPVVGSSSSANL